MSKGKTMVLAFCIAALLGVLSSCPITPPVKDESEWTVQSGSPIVSTAVEFGDSILAVSFQGQLFSIDTKTGRVQWKFNVGERVIYSPIVRGEDIFIHTAVDAIIKIDASGSSPKKLWSTADLPGETNRSPSQPIDIVGNTIYRYNGYYNTLSTFNADDGSLIVHESIEVTPNEDGWWLLSTSAIPAAEFDYVLIENSTVLNIFKDGQRINRLETGFYSWHNSSRYEGIAHTRYEAVTDPFLWDGRAWYLVEISEWEPTEAEEPDEPNEDYDDEYGDTGSDYSYTLIGERRLVLYELGPDGIDFDTFEKEFQLPEGESYFPITGNYVPYRDYIDFVDYYFIGWGFWYDDSDMYIHRYRFDDVSIHSYLIPRQLPGNAHWHDTIAVYYTENGDVLLHLGQKNNWDSFEPIEYFLYSLPGFFSSHSTDPPRTQRLHQLQPGTIAPGLMTDTFYIVSYRDDTIRAYRHDSGSIIPPSRTLSGAQE